MLIYAKIIKKGLNWPFLCKEWQMVYKYNCNYNAFDIKASNFQIAQIYHTGLKPCHWDKN